MSTHGHRKNTQASKVCKFAHVQSLYSIVQGRYYKCTHKAIESPTPCTVDLCYSTWKKAPRGLGLEKADRSGSGKCTKDCTITPTVASMQTLPCFSSATRRRYKDVCNHKHAVRNDDSSWEGFRRNWLHRQYCRSRLAILPLYPPQSREMSPQSLMCRCFASSRPYGASPQQDLGEVYRLHSSVRQTGW